MRAFLDGKEGDVLKVAKDSDVVFNGRVTEDDGGQHDLDTATVDLVVYSRQNRNVAATATHSATIDTAAAGLFTIPIADISLTYGPGRYYAFIRRTLSGVITFANKPTIIDIL